MVVIISSPSSIGVTALCCAHHGSGNLPIVFTYVACNGSEHTLASCNKDLYYYHYCGHDEDAAVSCNPGEMIADVYDYMV